MRRWGYTVTRGAVLKLYLLDGPGAFLSPDIRSCDGLPGTRTIAGGGGLLYMVYVHEDLCGRRSRGRCGVL